MRCRLHAFCFPALLPRLAQRAVKQPTEESEARMAQVSPAVKGDAGADSRAAVERACSSVASRFIARYPATIFTVGILMFGGLSVPMADVGNKLAASSNNEWTVQMEPTVCTHQCAGQSPHWLTRRRRPQWRCHCASGCWGAGSRAALPTSHHWTVVGAVPVLSLRLFAVDVCAARMGHVGRCEDTNRPSRPRQRHETTFRDGRTSSTDHPPTPPHLWG